MSITIEASTRTQLGRQAKRVRGDNAIPAVVYGHGIQANVISVPFSSFRTVYREAGSSSLVDISIDGKAPVKALIQEVQRHPLTMNPIHVDFYQVNMSEKMTANIPLVFIGESLAVKALGGTLVKAMDHLEVECLPADLPHEISVNISQLSTFDDMINIGSIELPKGVVSTQDQLQMIVAVEAPMTEEELKKLEESQVGDVAAVKAEAELKKEAQVAAEPEANATKA